jgi:hypothetical protein
VFSREFYEIIHIIGIALTMAALGGIALHAAEGGTKKGPRSRRAIMAAHGIGMFLILLGGFGMLARIGFTGGLGAFPGWLWGKLAVWFVIGGLSGAPYRKPEFAVPVLVLTPLLAGLAAYFALYKPF